MKTAHSVLLLLLVACVPAVFSGKNKFTGLKNTVTVSELKEWKKLIKTRNNVLVLFANGKNHVSDFLPMFEKVASNIRGKGTLVFVDCAAEAKKMCKNLKLKPSPYALKHYRDGSFHKEYDRLMEEKSMLSFMANPTADPPWSEDPSAGGVHHVDGPKDLEVLLRAEKKPILMFFYAPWCGHCKKMKPEMAAAASEVKGQYVLAGMDVDTPEAFGVREVYNITGFPTIIYFENGQRKFDYSGGRDKDGIIEWLKDPRPAEVVAPPPAEEVWSDVESDVVHLTTDTFDSYMSEHPSVLVMFYAPWCGHCKAMKPAYQDAARMLKEQEVGGVLAAVDATKEEALGKKYEVSGFPTIKYFGEGGEVLYEYGYGRTAEDLVEFMRSPKEPPPPAKDWAEEESAVNHLTDETFKSSLKKKRHSLVMFYAPWCGHCKAAKPEYTSAAEALSADKKVSFAALDCTKYDSLCKKHDVAGFPTFIYFNYGKTPFPYQGPRSQEGFVEFMTNPSAFLRTEL